MRSLLFDATVNGLKYLQARLVTLNITELLFLIILIGNVLGFIDVQPFWNMALNILIVLNNGIWTYRLLDTFQ